MLLTRLKNAFRAALPVTLLSLGVSTAIAAEPSFLPTEQYQLKIETVASGLSHPWGLAFLPDGRLLVTERSGQMRLVQQGQLSAPLAGLPKIAVGGQGGLLDVLLDNNFASNQQLYFSYSEPGADGSNSTAVASAKLTTAGLTAVKVIFSQQPKVDSKYHFGGRLVQQPDGQLFVTLGDRGSQRQAVQQLNSHIGKVVKIDTQGQAAAGNPFTGDKTAKAEIWSYGHRNIQGAALDPQGRLWTHEHGPQGGDEINITAAGKNYGWPLITYGEEYGGGVIGNTVAAGLEQPLHYWVPSIAPSGMSFYQGQAFSKWQHNLLVGSLKFGQLVRLEISADKVKHEERIRIGSRVRDVKTAPDGSVYLLTDEDNGAILKLTPLP
jgi:glucose/arabinose dehydrogenase